MDPVCCDVSVMYVIYVVMYECCAMSEPSGPLGEMKFKIPMDVHASGPRGEDVGSVQSVHGTLGPKSRQGRLPAFFLANDSSRISQRHS